MNEYFETLRHYNMWDDAVPDTGFPRHGYMDVLERIMGNRLVKVLTGQRRVGKSFLLRQMAVKLVNKGVEPRNIFMLNREFEDFSFLKTDDDLNALFKEYLNKMHPVGRVYIFIDEVQNIEGWERFVNSCSQDYMRDYEVFISGSNSKMLSGQLATLLSGRYVKIEVCPFSYDEYVEYYGLERGRNSYTEYVHTSGLPELYRLQGDDMRRFYISSLKDTVLLRDIIGRYNIRDVRLLEDIFTYIINNASSLLSVKNIINFMKSQGRKVSYETVTAYLQYIEDAFLIHSAARYNIKGKAVISGTMKYYANDLSFRNYLYRGFGYGDGYLLENTVYMELRRQGFDVYVGNIDNREVDFTAIKGDRMVYVQVALQISDEDTARREYASLEAISDSYEKYLVTLDEHLQPINNGIRHVSAWNFDLRLAANAQ